ncbi:MAG: hypothetical protein Kow0042_13140 [Calditrichia bacterium]
MLNRFFGLLLVVFLVLSVAGVVFAQEKPGAEIKADKETKYGVGFQATFPAYGISGMMDINEMISAQGIVGFFGNLNTYAVRGLYRFQQKNFWDLYGYGMVGAWSYTGLKVSNGSKLEETTETVLGFGAGVGIEYDWRGWNSELPPLFWNLELGLGFANFDAVDYNFSTLLFGAGVHYRF